ncbi:MAG: tyrosine-type recombinase/integrase [Vallitaleaceae bacterium]|nr:tyrosine-type recombinase/integrase [Vallitaleaceae bacterium]
MLVKCPECELQISDKAISCPHCGFPLQPDIVQRKKYTPNKRRRLPNGFGQISEIKNRNLRNPFRAMITVGKTSTGRPICKPLKPESYFPTYNDAYSAILEYRKNPYDLDPAITVYELYAKWTDVYFQTLKSDSSARTIKSAWAYCSSIYDMRVMDLRARHIKGCMDEGVAIIKGKEQRPTAGIKTRIKSMFNLMLDYALEYELVNRNYSRTFNISDDIIKENNESKRGHIPFTEDEMKLLWKNIDIKQYVDIVLIQCYSGWRPQELGLLSMENINLDEWTFTGGMKTDAGTNRVVPIHPKIRPLVVKRYKEAIDLGSDFLLNCTDATTHRSNIKLTYDKYAVRFSKIRDKLGLNKDHRAHDGRVHFTTMAKKYGVDEYAIKYIVGHSISDLTERVYTKRELDWLKEEMQKIR